jgi:hypothetical protein
MYKQSGVTNIIDNIELVLILMFIYWNKLKPMEY